MEGRPRLTVNIEIDDVQTETIHATSLNELYTGIENFFQTYHFTDPLVRQKIKERILTSFRNSQKNVWGQPLRELDAPADTALTAKENLRTPVVTGKGYSKNLPSEIRMAGDPTRPENVRLLVPTPSKSAVKNTLSRPLKYSSVLQIPSKLDLGFGKKRSAVNMKLSLYGPKTTSRMAPPWGSKSSRTGFASQRSRAMSKVYPKLAVVPTTSTFADIPNDVDNHGKPMTTPHLPRTPDIGIRKASVGVGANEVGYALLAENRSTEFNFPLDSYVSSQPQSLSKPTSNHCLTDHINKTQHCVPPLVAVANELESGKVWDNLTRSWAFPRLRSGLVRDTPHGNSASLHPSDSGVRIRHKPTNSDLVGFDPTNLDIWDSSEPAHMLYRRRTQADTPGRFFAEAVPRAPALQAFRNSPKTDQSPVEVVPVDGDDQGLRYFLKMGQKNERLIGVFRSLDEKRVGELSPANLNLSSVSSETLKAFKPVITHIYEYSGSTSPIDFTEFLRLVYKYEVNF